MGFGVCLGVFGNGVSGAFLGCTCRFRLFPGFELSRCVGGVCIGGAVAD